jgi:hypothetical protein
MLFLLIPAVWLALAAFVVILCRAAARSDTTPGRVAERTRPHVVAGGLLAWEDAPLLAGRLRGDRPASERLTSERLATYR